MASAPAGRGHAGAWRWATATWRCCGAIFSAVLSSAAGPVENILIARYTPSRYHGLGFGAKFVVAFGASPLAILLIAWVRKTHRQPRPVLFLGLAGTSPS